jgi:hypothetical protein
MRLDLILKIRWFDRWKNRSSALSSNSCSSKGYSQDNPQGIIQYPWPYCIFSISGQELVYTLHGGLFNMYRSIEGRSPSPCVGDGFGQFLEEFLFETGGLLAQHFSESKHTIKEILNRKLGLRKFC